MKKIYALLLAVSFVGFSCNDNTEGFYGDSTESEIELKIKTPNSGTRAADIPYPSALGTDEEKQITSLDLVAFDAGTGTFAYTRPVNNEIQNTYRTTVPKKPANVDVLLLANCPGTILADLFASDDWKGSPMKAEDFQKRLIDKNPELLVNSDNFQALPMFSRLLYREINKTGLTYWNEVELMRSVASVDVLVEKSNKTNKLEFKKVHAYYAANQGYVAVLINENDQRPQSYETPTSMTPTLNTLTATRVNETQTGEGGNVKEYNAIASQLYMYDNNSTTTEAGNECTRIIIEGNYNGAADPSFYPVFLMNGDKFSPIIRNNKYVIKVNEVLGDGYETIEEAAKSTPVNIEVEIIDWNWSDTEIGIGYPDQYYVSVERKVAYLGRAKGSTDEIKITYAGDDEFKMNFKDATNGAQSAITGGIANDRFEVTLASESSGKATLKIKAKGDFSATDSQNHDTFTLQYKDLRFEINIHQLDKDDNDWDDGGNKDAEL